MLLQIRDFIQRESMVSLQQLARALQVDEQALQPMLAWWLRKGVIQQHQATAGCRQRCSGCAGPIYYELIR